MNKMHLTSELQTPITFFFVNDNIKCEYAFSSLERDECYGTNIIWVCKKFLFAFWAPPFSVNETLLVAYNKYRIKRKFTLFLVHV